MNQILNNFEELNFLLQFLVSFAAGFITSLTPCVYPLIPITLAIFIRKDSHQEKPSLLLAITYFLGMSLTYVILGILAVITGSVFGQLLGHPLISILIFFILFILALYTLDLFQLNFLSKLQNIANRSHKSIFLMGATSGLIAAPCVGPVLVIILTLAAKTGSLWNSAALLFSYSLGLSVLFFVLAISTPMIQYLPRAGNWLKLIKIIIALAILILAFRFLPDNLSFFFELAPSSYFLIVFFLSILIFALALKAKSKIYIVLVIFLSLLLSFRQPPFIQGPNLWHSELETAFKLAKKSNKIIFIDLYADWCISCHELEEITFKSDKLTKPFNDFVLLRLDFTEPTDFTEDFSEKYDIPGLPTLLFLHPNGKEVKNTRINSFVNPDELRSRLAKVLASVRGNKDLMAGLGSGK